MAAQRERGISKPVKASTLEMELHGFQSAGSAVVFTVILLCPPSIHSIVTFCFNQVSHSLLVHDRHLVCTWNMFKSWLTNQKLMYHFKYGNRKQMMRKFKIRALAWNDVQNGFLNLILSRTIRSVPDLTQMHFLKNIFKIIFMTMSLLR